MSALREQVSPTGLTLFGPLPDTRDWYLMWPGPGARLSLAIRPFEVSGTTTRVDHPTANGVYDNRKDAREAANAFVVAYEENR